MVGGACLGRNCLCLPVVSLWPVRKDDVLKLAEKHNDCLLTSLPMLRW